jgi:putative cell wall-binding protein
LSTTQRRSLKRAAAGVSAGMLALASFAAMAPPASSTSTFSLTRSAGTDRYSTAARIATDAFPTAGTVLIANGESGHFADALTGNFLAGSRGGPILLTAAQTLPTATRDALTALRATNVIILGGESAVSRNIETGLRANYSVTRIGGANRYATAQQVAAAGGTVGSTEGRGNTALLASGVNFPDALVAGPLGYAGRLPVEITDPRTLSPETSASLTSLAIRHVVIVGGTAGVSQAVENAVTAKGLTVTRLQGPSRQATAVAVANYATGTASGLGFSKALVDLATGANFPDALTGGPSAGRDKAPLLLTVNATTLGSETQAYLTANSATLTGGRVFGGPSAVSDTAVAAAQTAGRATPPSNQTYAVSPSTAQTVTTSMTTPANAQFTVSNVGTSPVNIALFNCNNVATSSGTVAFRNSTNPGGAGNYAVPGTVSNETITVVNGASVAGAQQVTAVTPSNGTVSFTVHNSGTPGDCIVPVVYQQGAAMTPAANQLPLGTNNAPSVPFGAGGPTTFVTPAAPGAVPVSTVSGAGSSSFTQAGLTYTYGPNDVYQLQTAGACGASTFAEFQRRLSIGDSMASGFYNAPNQSTFCLNDQAPTPPATVAAAQNATSGGITITITPASGNNATLGISEGVTQYNVYRATATNGGVTGAPYTCPAVPGPANGASPQTPPSTTSAYTPLGNVSTTTPAPYTFNDTTATPTTGSTSQPLYCYAASSVGPNAVGGSQESTGTAANTNTMATTTGGGTTAGNEGITGAPPPAAAGAPTFASATAVFTAGATAPAGSEAITLTYNQAIACASVDGTAQAVAAGGSAAPATLDYTVSSGNAGVQTAQSLSGGTVTCGTSTTAVSGTTVALTFATTGTVTPGSTTFTVTARQGTDGNTVANTTTPAQFQPVGDAVQATTTAPAGP